MTVNAQQLRSGLRALLEVGKRNAARDQEAIQSIHDGAAFLGAACAADEGTEAAAEAAAVDRWLAGVVELVEAGLSHSDVADLLRAAVRGRQGPGYWCYLADIYDDSVVYEVSDETTGKFGLYQASYVIGSSCFSHGLLLYV